MARWRDSLLAGEEGWRPAREETLHLTLVFLGWRDEGVVGRVWDLTTRALRGLPAPTLTPAGIVPLPPRRPRLLALELEDDADRAAALHGALSRALEESGEGEPEARPFWPHVTLARARGRTRMDPPKSAPPPPRSPFDARVVTLYRSVLHPSGARYEPLERRELAKPG